MAIMRSVGRRHEALAVILLVARQEKWFPKRIIITIERNQTIQSRRMTLRRSELPIYAHENPPSISKSDLSAWSYS
jgi:hypothetical protein